MELELTEADRQLLGRALGIFGGTKEQVVRRALHCLLFATTDPERAADLRLDEADLAVQADGLAENVRHRRELAESESRSFFAPASLDGLDGLGHREGQGTDRPAPLWRVGQKGHGAGINRLWYEDLCDSPMREVGEFVVIRVFEDGMDVVHIDELAPDFIESMGADWKDAIGWWRPTDRATPASDDTEEAISERAALIEKLLAMEGE